MFYGWKLSLLSTFGNMMLQGGLMYIMNAFMEPLTELYGWSRTELSLSMGIAALASYGSMPLIATLGLRFGLRAMMTGGALVGGVCLALMGRTDNIVLYTLFFSLAWVAGQSCGGIIANALMNNWFVHNRGKAFGIANFGTSFSGAVLPFLALLLINRWGVETAYTILGAATVLLAPLCLLYVRDTPADAGLYPVNPPQATTTETTPTPNTGPSLSRNPEIYCIGLAFGLGLMCASGIMSQLKPRFSELGLPPHAAMPAACLSALFSALSKYGWGRVCDIVSPLKAARLLFAANIAILCCALVPLKGLLWVLPYSIALGLCCGGYWTVLPALVSHRFGGQHFLNAYRIASLFIILKAAAYPVLGLSYDLTGSYNASYIVYILLVCLGLLILGFVRAVPHDFR